MVWVVLDDSSGLGTPPAKILAAGEPRKMHPRFNTERGRDASYDARARVFAP
jgi:hypothetical protein